MKTHRSAVAAILAAAGALAACGSDAGPGNVGTGSETTGTSTTSSSTSSPTAGAGGGSSSSTSGGGGTETTGGTPTGSSGTSASTGSGGSATDGATGTGGSTGAGGASGGSTGGSGTGGGSNSDAGSGTADAPVGSVDAGASDGAIGPGPNGGWPGMTSLFDGKTLTGWDPSSKKIGDAPGSWDVQDNALHGLGKIRGSLATKGDYLDFRLIFSIRHLPTDPGVKDHQPCVLIWGIRPPPNDALGGIQFQDPNGGSWDYRDGKNNDGGNLFTHVAHTNIDNKQWSQCELLAHGSRAEARMACCSLGTAARCKGVEVLRFLDKAATFKAGPIGLQVHNPGLHDEYKDIYVEVNPAVDDYLTTH